MDAVRGALDALDRMRLAEGAHIARDLLMRVERLEEQRTRVKEIAPQIVVQVEDKQRNRLHFSYLQLTKNIVNPLMEMP